MLLWIFLALLVGRWMTGLSSSESLGTVPRGPTFVMEPPTLVEFTNDTGASVSCTAQGHPPPRVAWTQTDGHPLSDVPGARQARSDGTLHFPPFSGDGFRQGVHDAVYRCSAENVAGRILSREVRVKAVVLRLYKVQVYDEFVVRGNTAVLRCQVPAFVKDYLTYVWRRGDGSGITGDRYSILRTGELYIRSVTQTDGQGSYSCETRHRLTGDVVTSATAGSLFVTEPHGASSPKIVDYRPMMTASEGGTLEVPCAATGFPPPTYRWYREQEGRMVTLPTLGGRISQAEGSLTVHFVGVADSGRYVCAVNNSAGEDRVFTVITVFAPLSVYVSPQRQVSDVGRPARFNCSVSGHPLRSVTWMKDGLQLEVPTISRESLLIPTVKREDAGMYQCFVHNDFESAQGSAELKLGDVAPVLLSTFSGDSVRPGTFISLRCSASGNPLPQVTWSLDDSPVPEAPRFRMGDFVTGEGHVVSYVNISEIRSSDGGEYACAASNVVATERHAARLDVLGPPFVRRMNDVTAVAGRNVIIKCPVSGYPIESVVWKKDGTTLPTNHRQRLEGLNHLILEEVQRPDDEGSYVCEARGSGNRIADGSMHLSVLVPPVIESVLLPALMSSEEGKRTRLMCTVTQGDPPIQIRWLKDGSPLPLMDKELSLQSLEDSSVLVFRKTSSRMAGNYTCFASNAAATVNRTTRIIVNVPPRWTIEPSNSFAVVSQGIALDCAADGYPAPTIQWKKAPGSQAVDFRDVLSSYRRQVFENGSLSLREVTESDGGYYLCQAGNSIGGGLSKVVHLKIHTPPRFETKFVSHTVRRGEDAELECRATGEPDITIRWEKDKQPLDPEMLKRLSAVEDSSPQWTRSRLLIRSATRSDSALYTCTGTNEFGRDETNIQLVVQEPPSPPVDLVVQEKNSRSVLLSWSPTFSGNSPVTSYIVQYANSSDEGSTTAELSAVSVPGTETSGTVRDLVPATFYKFRVVAENILGQSEPGQFISVHTDEEVPGGPPLDVQVEPTGSQSLKVTWKAPRSELRHGPILGYYIGYRSPESSEPFQYKNVEASSSGTGLSYLTNLRRLTRYAVIVQAYNSVGAGPRSDEVMATTLEAAPPTSPVLSLHSVTPSSVTVTWDRPSDDTGIREYILHYKADGAEAWREHRLSTEGSRYTLEGLRCGTGYRLYMTATNSLGTGEPGDVLAARTRGAAPVSPPRETFITSDTTGATLHLGAWSSGGCPILRFSVQRRTQGQWEAIADKVDPLQQQMEVRHLVPNREYTLRVSAHSEAGTTEAEYRFTTLNLTMHTPVLPKGGGLFPSEGNAGGFPFPFHRNLTILLPVVISVLVLLVVIVSVIVCLRRQTIDSSEDGRKGRSLEHVSLSDFPRKGSKEGPSKPSSYYSSPARKHTGGAAGECHEYAEPYRSNVEDESPIMTSWQRKSVDSEKWHPW